MEKIHRTVYTIEVLSEGPFDDEVNDNLTLLSWIDYCINEGDCIGSVTRVADETLHKNEVKEHLIRIGNDGTYFDGRED